MNVRRLILAVGVAALGVGLLAAAYPGLVPLRLDEVLVSLVGVLALLEALRAVQRRRRTDLEEAEPPDPEFPRPTPAPGDDFDDVVASLLDGGGGYYRPTRVQAALRAGATAVLSRYRGHTEEEAEGLVLSGRWTDDRVAAAFLAGEDGPELPPLEWLRAGLRGEAAFERSIRRTVGEIAAIAGLPSGEDGERTGPLRRLAGTVAGGDERPRSRTADRRGPRPSAARGDGPEGTADGGIERVVREAYPTGHWQGIVAAALAGVGAGILLEQPAVLLAGAVGVGYAAYARSASPPPAGVSIERSVADGRPDPDEPVTVTVTLTNESERTLPDVRLVDGVPPALSVVEGSPRLGTALRPGGRATLEYDVRARRGVHEFDPATVVARDLTGGAEEERLAADPTTLTCIPPLRAATEPVPLREPAARLSGRVETAEGGEGVEFHAVREYRRGDAPGRIDWNRRARTGELATVEFREERAATVVLLIDAREPSYVAPAPDGEHAVDRSVAAAGRLFARLVGEGDRVGIAGIGAEFCWLAPDAGRDHRIAARRLLATDPALSPVPGEDRTGLVRWDRRLRGRLSAGTQVVLLTPLADDYAGLLARRLDAYGHPVTVVSPDPTHDRTADHRLARVVRTLRVSELRGAGVPVVDWAWDEPVEAALARDGRGVSR